jgi:hypothetical protein
VSNSAASRASKSPVTLARRTAADLLRSAGILVLMVAVGSLLGFRWQTSLLGLLGGLVVALLFGYAWLWVMAVIGLLVRTTEAVQAAVFVPTQTMPSWLVPFADHQPVTVLTNALRGLILAHGALPPGQTIGGQGHPCVGLVDPLRSPEDASGRTRLRRFVRGPLEARSRRYLPNPSRP